MSMLLPEAEGLNKRSRSHDEPLRQLNITRCSLTAAFVL